MEQELQKPPCESCKDKGEVTITTENYTRQEFDYFLSISNNYRFGKEETDFIYNLYNRVFKEKKQPGCGKCFTNVIKSLKKKYDGLYTQ